MIKRSGCIQFIESLFYTFNKSNGFYLNKFNMKTFIINNISFIAIIILVYSCVPTSGLEKSTSTKPEIIIQVASLNLGNLNRRIENKNINDLVKTLKSEKVELLAVQELTRYPGVLTRIDFVNELSKQTEWQNAFGEMANLSGRQTGNVIFSSYPIISYHNQTFDNVQSADFEAALEATVDAGVRTITVVSTQLPNNSTTDEQSQCIKIIINSVSGKTDPLMIITGNLPSSDMIRNTNSLNEAKLSNSVKGTTPKIWYSTDASIRLLNSRAVETELGKLIIAELGLFK